MLFLCVALVTKAQELYVFTEPASNMPANTFSPRLRVITAARENRPVFQRYIPEIMFGISKKLLVHAATTFANQQWNKVSWEGAYLYTKYRFYSADDVHKHFRMAAFAQGGYSKNPMYYDEISVQGDNSGVEAGLIATQLINKLAVSGTASYVKALFNNAEHDYHEVAGWAINYTLSAGYLILPVEYKNYDQLNVNLYGELLAQQTFGKRTWYIDAAPSIQFIFKSNARLNLGYRFQLNGNAERNVEKSFLIGLEYTFFNALRK